MTGLIDSAAASPLLIVSDSRRSGLVLCKGNFAEFVGPGAAVHLHTEHPTVRIFAVGEPELLCVVDPHERQSAYRRRIQWLRWLQKIAEQTNPMERAEKLLASFEAFFGAPMLSSLSDEVLALLVGVLPQTIATAREQKMMTESAPIAYLDANPTVETLDPELLRGSSLVNFLPGREPKGRDRANQLVLSA